MRHQPKNPNTQFYKVGGCVRDELMGAIPKDVDWLVVGGTPEEMLALGFVRVGADFPVFLHPITHEEYALARKERKTSAGHKGFLTVFDPSVTLEEDLSRRDLTINAIAKDPETGAIFDPFGGLSDLRQGVLRHVSEAFSEDPLRALRVARFRARTGFSIAPETMELCKQLSHGGFLQELSAERVCAELRKLFDCERPELGMQALSEMGALDGFDPQWRSRLGAAKLSVLALGKAEGAPEWALARLACCQGLDPRATQTLLERLRFPADLIKRCARVGLFCQWARLLDPARLDPAAAADAMERCGVHKLGETELREFSDCALAELAAAAAPENTIELARQALARAPSIAQADLSQALAGPKDQVPQAVKAAKAAAFGAGWPARPRPPKP